MRLLLILFISTICGIAAYSDSSNDNLDMGDAESVAVLLEDEAALTVMLLHTENRELKERVARQNGEIEGLQRKLAEAMARLDLEKIESGQLEQVAKPPQRSVSPNDLTQLQVLDVNRKMKVAVISGGLRAGMKVGMMFSVVRDDKAIAEVRLVDVRERIAGGLIGNVINGRFPETGDRLILRVTQD